VNKYTRTGLKANSVSKFLKTRENPYKSKFVLWVSIARL